MASRAHVFISGRVQGVNFRAATQRQANELEVTGFVRNLADGRVEAVFEGEDAAVQRMVSWCEQGPPAAHVEDVATEWETPTGGFAGFEVRR